ncbi:coiled-coil domain-containing protein 121 [Meriones unguiculatus]|uniref:coiled-coil domain-containing protein 121 n=1 Tax=Meriones unguiculatus TaxID=10047 RepID=UPI00293F5F55|nr:coiled-coil domain-containing protein 121 [Meriones unguiculatus]
MESQEQGNCISKDRSPRSGDKSRQFPRTNLVVQTKNVCDDNSCCARLHHVDPKVKTPYENCVPQEQTPGTSSLAKTVSKPKIHPDKHLSSGTRLAQSPKDSSQPPTCLSILSEFFKPERLTKLERKVERRTIKALELLNKNIKEARLRQESLLQNSRFLQEQGLYLENENRSIVDFLKKRNEHCKKKHEDHWNEYSQECGEIKRQKQELMSKFAQKNADLQTEILKRKRTQFELAQQIQSLKHISLVKENQEMRIQALQKELETMKAETAFKAHQACLEFLQLKACLYRELHILKLPQVGDYTSSELKHEAQTLESMAKKLNSELSVSINREFQELQKEVMNLAQKHYKLQSIKRKLEKWKKQLKEEQWYQEALARGRGHLKAKSKRRPENMSRSHVGHPSCTKSRIKPMQFIRQRSKNWNC